MHILPHQSKWDSIEFIDKGWSSDKKFKVQQNNDFFLIREFPLESFTEKEKEFKFIQKVYKEVSCSQPIEYGKIVNEELAYMILSFVEGVDLESVLPKLSLEEQYRLGFLAGNMLRKIHDIPIEEKVDRKHILERVINKKLNQLERTLEKNYQLPNQAEVVAFVKDNIHLIKKQNIVYQHGDYHPGNMIYTADKTISIIDFNRIDIGDPYEEFLKIASFTVESSAYFSRGQINGYFENSVPKDFWLILKIYSFHTALFSILWAETFGPKEVEGMVKRYDRIYEDYKNSNSLKPRWYREFDLSEKGAR